MDLTQTRYLDWPGLERYCYRVASVVGLLAAGTKFYWKLTLEDVNDIEYDAFMTTLAEFSKSPYIGGKSAVGLGEVAVKFDRWIQIDSRMKTEGAEIGRPVGNAYNDHLNNRGAEIKSILETV
jgi:hypothetical protein